ncbi:15680_t:CDS:2 [Funneliformis geosporum]|nr:15680_t:CDS:2 [Funneliformis geosporum]
MTSAAETLLTKKNQLSTTHERFVISTDKDLQNIQAYSHITNTDDNDTALQKQLCQFFYGVRKSGKKEYALSSLHVDFAAIARGLSDIFYQIRLINIHDKHKWKWLHEIFDGRIKQIQDNQDTSRKKTDALEM